jgi:hypothetical protein
VSEDGFELVMPFVLVKSNGGPYDDEAFDAGMACGQLWVELVALSPHEALPRPRYVPPEYVHQMDLIAMHFEYTLKRGETDKESGLVRIDFGPAFDEEERHA